jgi:hypothetical protein
MNADMLRGMAAATKLAALTERLRGMAAAARQPFDINDIDAIDAERARLQAEREEIEREHAQLRRLFETPTEKPKRKRMPPLFTKRDLARAIEGHKAAGLSVQRTEFDMKTGKIVVVTGQKEPTDLAPVETPETLRKLIS